MCYILKELYQEIYDNQFEYSLEHRIELQKAVYLLQNMGIYVGDYSFSWDKYGPYSMELDSDLLSCKNKPEQPNIVFSETAKKGINTIRKFLKEENPYQRFQWIECIASLHYLWNVLRLKNDEITLKELKQRKKYLNDDQANNLALNLAKKVGVFGV